MNTTKKAHYTVLAAILLIAIACATFIGEKSITGRTTMGIAHDYPYYLESPAYEHRPPVEEYLESNMPLRPERQPAHSYKLEPIDYIRSFFGTTMVFFPEQNPCAFIVQKYINRLDAIDTDRIETFGAGGTNDRFLTMTFEEEDKSMGKLTLIKGFNGKNTCRIRYEISKIVVGISSWSKTMDLVIETQGRLNGNKIYLEKGSAEVPGFDFQCSFGY